MLPRSTTIYTTEFLHSLLSLYYKFPARMVRGKKSIIQNPLGKVIWTIVVVIWILVRLPFWMLYFFPSQLRPHPKRTYFQALFQPLLNALLYHQSVLEVKTPASLEPGAEKERFVAINPLEKSRFRDILTDTTVQPAIIPGTWFPTPHRREPGSEEQIVVLYMHGGAFVLGGGRTAQSGFPASKLATSLNASVLSISYRLSSNPNCEFPAALQDAVSAYHYLLSLGTPASHIIIAGDSAGANLAISLLRYIAEDSDNLPPPRAAILGSPWVDLVSALDPDNVEKHRNASTDYLPGNFTAWGAREYVPSHIDAASPYISPLNYPFYTKASLWICVGGLEILCDQGIRFADNMRGKGNKVMLHVEPFASHSFAGSGNLSGFQKEAEKVFNLAGEWIRDCGS